jgi:hypothetical protein
MKKIKKSKVRHLATVVPSQPEGRNAFETTPTAVPMHLSLTVVAAPAEGKWQF